MLLTGPGRTLEERELATPEPAADQVLIRVHACGVCRTDLHVVDGELSEPKLPLIPGHEIVGTVVAKAAQVDTLQIGQRVGVPWLGHTCGHCAYCLGGQENLCDQPAFTGYQIDGGYAEYTVADAGYCFPIPDCYDDAEAAPLLCAGLIGYRSLTMTGDARRLGIYGFGAAAHILAQVAVHQDRELYGFTRPGDTQGQAFARRLGCRWAGGSDELPPAPLDAAILFAPVGALVPAALAAVRKGGTVVCGGIHMSDIPRFAYAQLWGERKLCSVANLTRDDGRAFFELAPKVPVRTVIERFPLAQANEALDRLRNGRIEGAAVLIPAHEK